MVGDAHNGYGWGGKGSWDEDGGYPGNVDVPQFLRGTVQNGQPVDIYIGGTPVFKGAGQGTKYSPVEMFGIFKWSESKTI